MLGRLRRRRCCGWFGCGLSPAAVDRAFSRAAAGGDRPAGRRRRRANWPSSLTRLPLNEILRLEVTQMGARRAAIGAGPGRTVDRPSLRSALHRPRGQGIFPRSRPHQQRAAARSGVHHRRHRRSARRVSTGLPIRSDNSPRGTACISSSATRPRVDAGRLRRTLAQSGLVDLGGRWLLIEMGGTPVLLAGYAICSAGPEDRTCLPS